MNATRWNLSLKPLLGVLAAVAGLVAPSFAADVYLVAKEFTKKVPSVEALTFEPASVLPYNPAEDLGGITQVQDGGQTLRIVGIVWRKVAYTYDVTPDTVLEFDFKSTSQGFLHAIGFDDNDTPADAPDKLFQVYGTVTSRGNQDHNDYAADAPAWKHYRIPVGAQFTGPMTHVVFVADDGIASGAESYFRNVQVFEAGAVSEVAMWGYALDKDGDLATDDAEVPTSPGPMIRVDPTDSVLNIHLRNDLATAPTSIMIPGQNAPLTPTWIDATGAVVAGVVRGPGGDVTSRLRSFAAETAPGATGLYSWSGLQPGTYLYQSATHVQVQVQMGLYGAMLHDAAAGEAYAGVPYDTETVLLYSEIDPVLHEAVAANCYGPAASMDPTCDGALKPAWMSSTIAYQPGFFLVNGSPFDPADPAAGTYAGPAPGERGLLRLLNAGLASRAPTLNGLYMSVVAEDGNPYPFPREEYGVLLAAGKTLDAVITPSAEGTYGVYDRRLGLSSGPMSQQGDLSLITVATAQDTVVITGKAYFPFAGGVVSVQATSSAAPGAALTLSAPGAGLAAPMTYVPALGFYTGALIGVGPAPVAVEVTSSEGGSAATTVP